MTSRVVARHGLRVCLLGEGRNGAKNRQLALEGSQKFRDSLWRIAKGIEGDDGHAEKVPERPWVAKRAQADKRKVQADLLGVRL